MKLYYSPGACSLSPHIVLCEASLAHELVKVDLKTKKTEFGDDFAAISPKSYVPTLVLDDGEVLTEGPAIVQYLADLAPASRLAPAAGSFARVRLQEWLNFIASELHKGFGQLFRKPPAEWQEIVRGGLAGRLAYVAETLDRQPYLLGANFSVADAYLFTILNWAKWVKFDLAPWPVLDAYLGRVAARPGVQKALKTEGLL
ncbi:glutathione transferase GstA [Azospira restricta]|uniref:Glutathione transferase GstA n=1 Tax=Azospira restricta TaxID=404405 RepID=A0A974Y364_9RHOO|nr:glutathione transferase GstA [Azospira restricta]QRJ63738.1 glutathione transferase GstA [Azospira restricta]